MNTNSDLIQFCNDHLIKLQIIEMVQSLIYKTNQGKVARIYKAFEDVYYNKQNPDDKDYHDLIETKVSGIKNQISECSPLNNFEISERDTHIGVDFPTWFNFTDNKPKLMLVGIDPLRTGENLKDKISIGTPYNIHTLKNLGKNLESNLFWKLISGLAKDYSVYVTDTFKVFFMEESDLNRRSYNCPRFTNPDSDNWEEEIHQKIFQNEVDIISPDAIITLGRKPVQWFTSLKTTKFKELKKMVEDRDERLLRGSIPILAFPHLSGLSRNGKELYGVGKRKELPEQYISTIDTYLRKN